MSFVNLPESNGSGNSINSDRTKICFNYGRELFVYTYRGIKKAVDLTKPIDKRAYNKEDVPTCHDFNSTTASGEGVSLLVGLLGGQVQLIDPITKEVNKAYNAGERLIDKTKVTCVKNSLASEGLGLSVTSYRLGSVGQDTLLCLWDLKDDVLRQPYLRPRSSTVVSSSGGVGSTVSGHQTSQSVANAKCNNVKESSVGSDASHHSHSTNSLTAKLANLNFGEKKDKEKGEKDHKRSLSLASKNSTQNCKSSVNKNQVGGSTVPPEDSCKTMGTSICPRLDECPVLEPMICKKIGHERLSGLVFREDCLVTSCQDGCVLTWCRPGKQPGNNQHSTPSPTIAVAMGGGPLPSGGTVV
ncbi:putative WD-repeat protein [Penaeus vannamei]|uniref:Putative WD-repeat protein n=1 Tax=Penaeus vannamei TaxID=6689 RepID=A0A3R7PX52_PENVA|nr:putative WD-repeat protein [Penaeus vannamei]ROT85446.1 putative WD-repeat protein [Penaeus vannamei]